MKAATMTVDPGKARSLQRVTTEDGFFVICALDHLSDFQELLDPAPGTVTYNRTVDAKMELIRALAPEVSAFLLDARYALAQAVVSRALPATCGLMASIEDEGYNGIFSGRETKFREGWGTKKIKLMGTDVCKLLWLYRPDSPTAEHQRNVVSTLVAECAALSLPLVVEPIWYPLDGEDVNDPAWKARRVEGILESAKIANDLGVDMLKVEFPGYVDTPDGRSASVDACQRLDAQVDKPWVILSAGVGYDDFKTQVEISCKAGASGFLAGRSIWRDAASTHDPAKRAAGIDGARARLAELSAVTRANGRPYAPAMGSSELASAFPEFWYKSWQ